MTPSTRLAILCALALVLTACSAPGGSPGASASGATTCAATPAPAAIPEGWDVSTQRPSVYPSVINPPATIACGPTRLMFSFLDADSKPIARPERSARVRLFDLGADAGKSVAEAEATFIWAIEPRVGVYVADVALPTSGAYGIEFTTSEGSAPPEIIRATFDVQTRSSVVAVGDKAPASDTPTLGDVGGDVTKLSTDTQPVEAFYGTSIADAVAAKKPFVVAFATPKFCVTQQCGPTLDRLKPIAARHPDVTFINVEPYQLEFVDGQLQPILTAEKLTPATSTEEWRLPTEPWVFVVDKDGIVTDSFMLIFGDGELETALDALG